MLLIPAQIMRVSEAAATSIAAASSETMMEGKTVMPPSTKFIIHSKSATMPVMHTRTNPSYKE
jgi:hypothetical protein